MDRGGDRNNRQVCSGQVEPWMPGSGCFWIPHGAGREGVRLPRAPGARGPGIWGLPRQVPAGSPIDQAITTPPDNLYMNKPSFSCHSFLPPLDKFPFYTVLIAKDELFKAIMNSPNHLSTAPRPRVAGVALRLLHLFRDLWEGHVLFLPLRFRPSDLGWEVGGGDNCQLLPVSRL